METFSIGREGGALRLDRAIADRYGVSAVSARRLIAEGAVRVNGRAAPKGLLLRPGDEVQLTKAPERPEDFQIIPEPQEPLVVLYEDEHLIAIEKPSGVPTHPLRAGELGTAANALVARLPECARSSPDRREAGISHRLDRETSGVLLAARSQEIFLALRAAFAAHEVKKSYLAIVEGTLAEARTISLPLAHHPGDRRRMLAVTTPREAKRLRAQEAETYVEPLGCVRHLHSVAERGAFGPSAALGLLDDAKASPRRPALRADPNPLPSARSGGGEHTLAHREGCTLVRAQSSFGRMHQIRAHLAAVGFPLVGDVLYGGTEREILGRPFFLHAERVQLTHPVSGQALSVTSPLPAEAEEYFRG